MKLIKDKKFYYVEPVEIEIYLKNIGKVRTIIKDMYVELIDVEPIHEKSKIIFDHFRELDEPIDLMEIQNFFPQYIKSIYDSYYKNIDLYEKLSTYFKGGLSNSASSWRLALYLNELLIKYEPTIASTQYIGDFQTYNMNYLIIKLNELNEKFLLEDSTVAFLIKRRNFKYQDMPLDKEFAKLVELWHYNIKENILS